MSDQPGREIEREERAIYMIMLAACAPILIALAIEHRAIDGGNALMVILVVLGLVGLGTGLRSVRTRLPRARVVRRRSS